MIKKSAELRGVELDIAVAIALGLDMEKNAFGCWVFRTWGTDPFPFFLNQEADQFNPTQDWGLMGKVIDHHGLEFKWVTDATIESYSYTLVEKRAYGLSHLESACRLLVMSLVGDEILIPERLLEVYNGKRSG